MTIVNIQDGSSCITFYQKFLDTDVLIYGRTLPATDEVFADCRVIKDFNVFKCMSKTIVVNRYDSSLDDVKEKVYTRDIFCRD